MKTFRIFTIAAIATLFLQTSYAAIPVDGRFYENPSHSGNMVKAIYVDGGYRPVVDLPEVEIISFRKGNGLLKGIIDKGHVMAVVELPVVEISVSRSSTNDKISDYEAIYDLPVIEIEGTYPQGNFVKGIISQNTGIPVVDLPEITIVVDKDSEYNWMVFVADQDGIHDNSETLPFTTIKLIMDGLEKRSSQLANISLDLSNCIVQNNNTVVCEFVTEASEFASQEIKKGFLRLLFSK